MVNTRSVTHKRVSYNFARDKTTNKICAPWTQNPILRTIPT